jgi:hypothetical protein
MGMDAQPLQVEATLLSFLMFTGVAVAWMLMFDATPSSTPASTPGSTPARGTPRS